MDSGKSGAGQIELCLASRITNGMLLLFLFVFGVLANVTICKRLHKKNVLFKKTTLILLNLAVTDLLGCVVLMPMEFIQLALNFLPDHAKAYSAVLYSLQNFFLSLDCCCIILLSIDREELVRRPFAGRQKFNSARGTKAALAGAWLLATGEAVLTYFTTNDRTPWKFQNGGVSRILEPGDFVAKLIVFIAIVVVVVSFRQMQNLLKRTSENFVAAGVSRKIEVQKRRRRVSHACVVTVCSLLISYLPAITANVVWWASGLQSFELNSFCAILSTVIHALNPVICAGLSQKVRRDSVTRCGPLVSPIQDRQRSALDLITQTQPENIRGADTEVTQSGKGSPQSEHEMLYTLKITSESDLKHEEWC